MTVELIPLRFNELFGAFRIHDRAYHRFVKGFHSLYGPATAVDNEATTLRCEVLVKKGHRVLDRAIPSVVHQAIPNPRPYSPRPIVQSVELGDYLRTVEFPKLRT